jgi:small-conductance mechanosensitive channel
MQESYSEQIHDAVSDSDIGDRVSQLLQTFASLEESDPLTRFILAAGVTGISILLMLGIRLIFRRRIRKLEAREDKSFRPLRWQAQDLLSSADMQKLWISMYRTLNWAVTLVLVLAALIGVLMLSNRTLDMAAYLITLILETLEYVWRGFVDYLPDLITIIVILLVVRLVIRTIALIFEGLKNRRIHLKHFYPEWADTSLGLVKLLIYVLTAVIIFPYLPGSSSPAFQGISIFVGVLVSLGSTAVVANVVAGVVLTYTRAFKKGDQVKIGDVRGIVLERTTFVTRIQALKNEIVSVPNSMTLSQNIVNYSQNEQGPGILIHSTITIGYDVPWKKVNELLIGAALRTEHIESEPEPFVLQSSLDDYYVSYEINGWTRHPEQLPRIYSNLHANILDEFHGHDVEIMSPAFRAERDGSEPAMPPREKGPENKGNTPKD